MHTLSEPPTRSRRGFTLVELLVATAIALSLMLFTATVFSVFGRAVGESQDLLRLHDQMRSAAFSLRQDLAGITCSVRPWQRPESDAGYFELVEGPQNDYSGGSAALVTDIDDVLMFTTQRLGNTFVGSESGRSIESPAAEVAWFCLEGDNEVQDANGVTRKLYNLHRRRFLIRSYVGTAESLQTYGYDTISGTLPAAYRSHDLSLRQGSVAGQLLPNGLSDVTKRENRFFHGAVSPIAPYSPVASPSFPYAINQAALAANRANCTLASGEDIILNNVIAFDVRVFDPQQTPPAYVDLAGAGEFPRTVLTDPADPKSELTATYCTWTEHYEADGPGTNGVDDDDDGIPDNYAELLTAPPYDVPLLGIEVRIRCIEPKSKQIRQITVRHSFRR